jgi:hypothetical protein
MARIASALLAALILAFGAEPAAAQRKLDVPAASGWQHAQTGLVLHAKLAGLPRTDLTDSGNAELDVMAQFGDEADTAATVYVFRPALMSVPIWFDRSETAILLRSAFGTAAPVAAPLAFASPLAKNASGLRRVYVPSKGPYKSTALAMLPLGEWLVAVRISSQTLDPVQLDAKLSEAVATIGWPKTPVPEAEAASAVAPCGKPLAYAKKAKLKKADMSDALMGAIMSTPLPDDAKGKPGASLPKPSLYCRELPPAAPYGVYRAPEATGAYVMALGDAGVVINIGGMPLFGDTRGVAVSLADLEGTSIYPPFESLPNPDQVIGILRGAGAISRTSRNGKDMTITINTK